MVGASPCVKFKVLHGHGRVASVCVCVWSFSRRLKHLRWEVRKVLDAAAGGKQRRGEEVTVPCCLGPGSAPSQQPLWAHGEWCDETEE